MIKIAAINEISRSSGLDMLLPDITIPMILTTQSLNFRIFRNKRDTYREDLFDVVFVI